ncbi:DUF2474 domain-containing protein [Pusillimonas sp. T2]|nr:DUF2474 family protein [Pusillimonas sp. T2]OXR49335.1 DUF2474 domain-containing protein [Pusillimonas sp. T2]
MTAPQNSPPSSWRKRLGWLVLLWLGGVLALSAFAGLLRLIMNWVGMTA